MLHDPNSLQYIQHVQEKYGANNSSIVGYRLHQIRPCVALTTQKTGALISRLSLFLYVVGAYFLSGKHLVPHCRVLFAMLGFFCLDERDHNKRSVHPGVRLGKAGFPPVSGHEESGGRGRQQPGAVNPARKVENSREKFSRAIRKVAQERGLPQRRR